MVLEEFVEKCQSGRCMRNTMQSPQCKKQYKQEQCFDKYTKKLSKDKEKRENKFQQAKDKKPEQDEKWVEVRENVKNRDNNLCRLFSILTKEEKIYLIKDQFENLWLNKTIDPAHVIPRSKSKKLIYCEDNIVMLGRLFHSRLDSMKNPLTGDNITKDEHTNWWIRIVGEEVYNWLATNK